MTDVNGLKPGAPVRAGRRRGGHRHRGGASAASGAGMVEVDDALDRRVQARVTDREPGHARARWACSGEKAVDITAAAGGTPIQDGGYVAGRGRGPVQGPAHRRLASRPRTCAHPGPHGRRRGPHRQGPARRGALRPHDRREPRACRRVMAKLESEHGPAGPAGERPGDVAAASPSPRAGIEAVVARDRVGPGRRWARSPRTRSWSRDLKAVTAQPERRWRRGCSGARARRASCCRTTRSTSSSTRLSPRLDDPGRALERGEGSAGRLLNDPELYNNLNGAAKDAARAHRATSARIRSKYLRVQVKLF